MPTLVQIDETKRRLASLHDHLIKDEFIQDPEYPTIYRMRGVTVNVTPGAWSIHSRKERMVPMLAGTVATPFHLGILVTNETTWRCPDATATATLPWALVQSVVHDWLVHDWLVHDWHRDD